MDRPLVERKALLASLLDPAPPNVLYARHIDATTADVQSPGYTSTRSACSSRASSASLRNRSIGPAYAPLTGSNLQASAEIIAQQRQTKRMTEPAQKGLPAPIPVTAEDARRFKDALSAGAHIHPLPNVPPPDPSSLDNLPLPPLPQEGVLPGDAGRAQKTR